jgi:hypothetical protein
MRFLPVAALVAIIWCNTSDESIEKLFRHSYITLRQQSLDKMSIFGGFFAKSSPQIGYPAVVIRELSSRITPPKTCLAAERDRTCRNK